MRFFEQTHRGFSECGPALSVPAPAVFPPFAVPNSNAVASDAATLIHEMIHTADSTGVDHVDEATSVFFGECKPGQGGVERTTLRPDRALTLSKAARFN